MVRKSMPRDRFLWKTTMLFYIELRKENQMKKKSWANGSVPVSSR